MIFEKIKKVAGYLAAISSSIAATSLAIYAFGSIKVEPKTEPKVIVNVENKICVNSVHPEPSVSKASLEELAKQQETCKKDVTVFKVVCSKGSYKVKVDFLLDRENYELAYLWLGGMLACCKGQGLSDKAINHLLKCVDSNRDNVLGLCELKDFETRFYRKNYAIK